MAFGTARAMSVEVVEAEARMRAEEARTPHLDSVFSQRNPLVHSPTPTINDNEVEGHVSQATLDTGDDEERERECPICKLSEGKQGPFSGLNFRLTQRLRKAWKR